MKSTVKIILIIAMLCTVQQFAQQRRKDARDDANQKQISSVTATIDRAMNVITINQLGQVVTNMGQFHAYQGVYPKGRWPINTSHDQMYKMSFAVGIPYNVANARASGTKEWDPIPGDHNLATGKIAISTDKTTWPLDGNNQPYWPVRTKDGKDSIVSQQDTYCRYRDLTNARPNKLNIVVTQTSYAWSTSKDQDYIIWKLELLNDTTAAKDSLYFGIYYDFDAGGIVANFSNDYYVWDSTRQLTYVVGPTGETGWEPGSSPFLLGLMFLETPMIDNNGKVVSANGRRPGITDWHYSGVYTSAWGDNPTDDTIFYNWMSSAEILRNNPNRPTLFHGPNRHIDDWRLQDTLTGAMPDGDGVDGLAASGPYHMEPGQKMTFIFAELAQRDQASLYKVAGRIQEIYNNGLRLTPPPKPTINYTAFDKKIKLSWSNANDLSYINPQTGKSGILEYRVYKTTDPYRAVWGDPVAIIKRDTTHGTLVNDLYSYQDSIGINNYFYYSYAVTVLDVDSIESGKALLPANQSKFENVVEARPVASPRKTLSDVKVVPNPYIISSTWERKRLGDVDFGEPIRDLAFTNLPNQCTIRIYTLDGTLVKTIEHTNGTGAEFWNLRSSSNQLIATGIYIYHVKSEFGDKVSKFAVVR
ncbi:MAG: T9SS type A sorting domain-containing protein [Ignavibacteria bacterium]|nr:T9SS type A sorting domain-containing protein [Ignavibacteria bacterium]